jgi:hypothetical protein
VKEGLAMAYWVTAYCTTEGVPTIRSLLEWLWDKDEFQAAHTSGESPRALDSPRWKSFELVYHPDKESLLVECHRNTGPRSLCAQQVRGELESLEDLPDSAAKRQVADCLRRARFKVRCTVLQDHHHREGFTVRSIRDYFVDHCGAILDVEDEGFYARSDKPLLGLCAQDAS